MKNIFFPMELLAALFVFSVRLERREHFWLRIVGAISLNGTLLIAWVSQEDSTLRTGMYSGSEILAATAITCMVLFLLLILIVWIPFRVSMQEAVYCVTCAYLTEHIAYALRLLINGITGSRVAESGTILYFAIHICVYLLSYYIFARRMSPENHYVTSAVRSLGLMVAVLFLVLGMSVAATAYGFETIHSIYALFCCIFVLYSQLKQQSQLSLQEELNIQQQLWMRHKAQYEMSKETIDIINQKCHDLRHQVAALKTIENIEKRADAIDSIEESVMIYDSMLKTGNVILDTVLTEKSLICNQQKIKLTCIADGGLLEFMDAVDLYTLFGNALDNAIEGVQKLPEEGRFISLLLHEKAGLIFIQVENRYLGTIQMEDGLPVTSKTDKDYHGFGVKSIVQIVEKYHGFATIETEQQIFLLRLTIPVSR